MPCSSWVAQDRNGMMGVQTVPNSTFAPPSFSPISALFMALLPPQNVKTPAWDSPQSIPVPLPLLSRCSHHSSDENRSEAALCGEPRSFVARKKRGSSRWPSFFRAKLCTRSTKQFLSQCMRLLPRQWNFMLTGWGKKTRFKWVLIHSCFCLHCKATIACKCLFPSHVQCKLRKILWELQGWLKLFFQQNTHLKRRF